LEEVLICEPPSRPTISSEYRSGARWDPGHSSDDLSGGERYRAQAVRLANSTLQQAQRDLKAVENVQAYGRMRRPSKACTKLLMLEITGGNIRHALHGYLEQNSDAISAVYDAAGKSDNQDDIPEKFVSEVRVPLVIRSKLLNCSLATRRLCSPRYVSSPRPRTVGLSVASFGYKEAGLTKARDISSGLSYLR